MARGSACALLCLECGCLPWLCDKEATGRERRQGASLTRCGLGARVGWLVRREVPGTRRASRPWAGWSRIHGELPLGSRLWTLEHQLAALAEPPNQLPVSVRRSPLSFRKTMLNDLLRFDVKDCSWCRWVPPAQTRAPPGRVPCVQGQRCFEELMTAPSPSLSDPWPSLFFLLPDFLFWSVAEIGFS